MWRNKQIEIEIKKYYLEEKPLFLLREVVLQNIP
jgi:hypothetical protein